MTKADLIKSLSDKLIGMSEVDAERAVDSMIEDIIAAPEQGDRVNISGFGTFTVSQREARIGQNPRTRESIQIPASRAAKFKPGKELKAALNDAGSEGNHISTPTSE